MSETIDYGTAKSIFWLAATETTKGTYQVDEENKHVLQGLTLYFSRQPEFETDTTSLQKGVLLSGAPGTGKTLLLRLFRALVRDSDYSFRIATTLQVADDYAKNGTDAIHSYNGIWCFDDLGVETAVAHYGDRRDVMTELIHHRYRLWQERGTVTHFSTMLDADAIITRYGEMSFSRIIQMCNWFRLGDSEVATNRRFFNNIVPIIPDNMPRFFAPKHAAVISEMQKEYEAYRQRNKELPPFKPGIGSLIRQHIYGLG